MTRNSGWIAALLVALGCGAGGDERIGSADEPIAGGQKDDGDTAVVAYRPRKNDLCGGVLVAPNAVLTARHCAAFYTGTNGGEVVCGKTVFTVAQKTVDMGVSFDGDALAATATWHGVSCVVFPDEPAAEELCGGDVALLILSENIAAAEVESCLQAHEAVAQVAVLAAPDEIRGDEVMACIVTMPSVQSDAQLAADLVDWCLARLAYFKAPGFILFMDSLPHNWHSESAEAHLAVGHWHERWGGPNPSHISFHARTSWISECKALGPGYRIDWARAKLRCPESLSHRGHEGTHGFAGEKYRRGGGRPCRDGWACGHVHEGEAKYPALHGARFSLFSENLRGELE